MCNFISIFFGKQKGGRVKDCVTTLQTIGLCLTLVPFLAETKGLSPKRIRISFGDILP